MPGSSEPIVDGDDSGRGSLAYFNQASMFQASETGYGSIAAAKRAGVSGRTDFGRDAQQAFTDSATFIPIEQ